MILQEYKQWIIDNQSKWYEVEEEDGNFIFKTSSATTYINFYEFDDLITCEMKITNACTEEDIFYLHFELKDLDHAKEMFHEMIDVFRSVKDQKKMQALLCCSSGLTTSFFAMKLNEAAEVLSMDIEFNAESYTELYEAGQDKDVILLAPQIGFYYQKVKDIFPDKVVIKVPAAVFASYDTGAMLSMIQSELAERAKQNEEEDINNGDVIISSGGEWGCFMVILFINDKRKPYIIYRVYNECQILEERTYMKEKWNVTVYEDILDTVLPRFPEIENVYIASPGIVSAGKLSNDYYGVVDEDIVARLTRKYHKRFNFCNVHNAITMGYYMDHKDEFKNFVFFYQSFLAHSGGAGIILDGKMYFGRNHLAGEIHYMLRSLHFSDAYHYLAKTPEGQTELTAKQMLPIILSFDPEAIAFYNPMVSSTDDIKEIWSKYLPKRLHPQLIKVDDEIEYMFWGAMLIGRAFIDTNKVEFE